MVKQAVSMNGENNFTDTNIKENKIITISSAILITVICCIIIVAIYIVNSYMMH